MGQRSRAIAVFCVLGLAGATRATTLSIVNDRPGAFTDISTTGTPLNLGADGATEITATVGNDVFSAGTVCIANEGVVGYNIPAVDCGASDANEPIPSLAVMGGGQVAVVGWDDIDNDVGNVYVQQSLLRGPGGGRVGSVLIIQWHNREFGGSTDTSRFQLQVFDPPLVLGGDEVFAQFIYDDIEQPRAGGGASMTIGYQDGGAGFNDVQWSFNTPNAVANGTVLSIVPEPATGLLLAAGALALLRRRHTEL